LLREVEGGFATALSPTPIELKVNSDGYGTKFVAGSGVEESKHTLSEKAAAYDHRNMLNLDTAIRLLSQTAKLV